MRNDNLYDHKNSGGYVELRTPKSINSCATSKFSLSQPNAPSHFQDLLKPAPGNFTGTSVAISLQS